MRRPPKQKPRPRAPGLHQVVAYTGLGRGFRRGLGHGPPGASSGMRNSMVALRRQFEIRRAAVFGDVRGLSFADMRERWGSFSVPPPPLAPLPPNRHKDRSVSVSSEFPLWVRRRQSKARSSRYSLHPCAQSSMRCLQPCATSSSSRPATFFSA